MFLRILSLYSLTNFWDERENDKGQPQQLTTALLVNQGKMTFPIYEIIRQRKIFRHRQDLMQFELCCSIESKMTESTDNKDWDASMLVLEEAQAMFKIVLKDEVSVIILDLLTK